MIAATSVPGGTPATAPPPRVGLSATPPPGTTSSWNRRQWRDAGERYDVLEDAPWPHGCAERVGRSRCFKPVQDVLLTPFGPRGYCPTHFWRRRGHYERVARILDMKVRDA